jgi:hypothetical protein
MVRQREADAAASSGDQNRAGLFSAMGISFELAAGRPLTPPASTLPAQRQPAINQLAPIRGV